MRLAIGWCVLVLAFVHAAVAAPRRALVIGNDSYPGQALSNARNDARSIAEALSEMGYKTSLALDSSRTQLVLEIENFVDSVQPGDTAVVYYAGHGLQVDGENYLVPVDFHVSDEVDAKHQGYSLSRVLEKLSAHGATTQIVVLDACRNNPFISSRSLSGGWADMVTSAGTFLAFGTAPGSTASDDPLASHGLFTLSLLKFLKTSPLDVESMFQKVRLDVIRSSGGRQVPWTASSLVGTLHMNPEDDGDAAPLTGLGLPSRGNAVSALRGGQSRGLSGAEWSDADSRSTQINQAMNDLRALRLSSAISILKDILSVSPTYSLALRLLGLALHLSGRNIEAVQTLTAAITADPQDGRSYMYRCLVRTVQDPQVAMKDCERGIALNGELPQSHIGLALDLSALGRDKDAYDEIGKALVLENSQVSVQGGGKTPR